jgi:hypothetical protein
LDGYRCGLGRRGDVFFAISASDEQERRRMMGLQSGSSIGEMWIAPKQAGNSCDKTAEMRRLQLRFHPRVENENM